MVVTNFIQDEKVGMISEPDEWKKRIDELELDGQKELIATPDSKPIPFLRLTEEHRRVLEVLCQHKTKIKEYKEEAIPLESLAMVGLAIKEGYFEKIEVWHNYGAPDPVIVGNGEYLLSQWGPERMSYDAQKELALKKWKDRALVDLKATISNAENAIQTIDAMALKHFSGGWVHIPSY